MAVVELRGLRKAFAGGAVAVAGLDLTVGDGEFVALVGPSGSGKTTLLRLIAGLEAPDSGRVVLAGRDVTDLPPDARDVAMVFQTPALYPYLSVFDNLAFGLRSRGLPRREVRERVGEVAGPLGLGALLRRKPGTLSGGQGQRVALGRAVARRPGLFLLDEPLTGLDAPLRAALRADLSALRESPGASVILVTHDQAEALALGNRVGVLNGGRLVQVGTPRDLYDRPADRFVAGFLGVPPMSVVPARAVQESSLRALGQDASGPDLGFRPEHLSLAFAGEGEPGGVAWLAEPGVVRRLEYQGHETRATLAVGAFEVVARLDPGRAGLAVGAACRVGFDPGRCTRFDPGTGQAVGSAGA